MIKKKICLLGTFGVGKTSLIRKYVQNIFSDEYITTIGVKIEKKTLILDGNKEILLVIWDLEGSDDFHRIIDTYLKGMSGYFVVADGTNPETIATAQSISAQMKQFFPDTPSVLLLNKYDLAHVWAVPEGTETGLTQPGQMVLNTSAKTGMGVEEAFEAIAIRMVETQND
jgi:hypothetical protein